MPNAIGYTRLSQDSDTSIDRQKDNIRAYADEHGFDLERIYDDGERSSGFETESREEYQRVRERVANGEIDAVIVNDKRRLARDIDEVMRLIPDLRTNEVELHTHQDGRLDLSDPMKAAIEIMQAAAAYEEKLEEIRKAIAAFEERKANGCYQGSPPFGLRFADDNCHLERDPDEWDDLQWAFEQFGDLEQQEIAARIGLDESTVSLMRQRGFEYYEQKLAEYGV